MLIRRRFYKGLMATMRRNHLAKYRLFFRYNAFTLRREYGRRPNPPQFRFKVKYD